MPDSLHAVLFDMDGTLVETEEHWGEALFALARRLGGRLSPAARRATVGSSMRTSMGIVYDDLGITRSEEQLVADTRWVEDTTAGLLAQGISWRPGACELIAAVRDAGLPTALVTTTPRNLATLVLDHIETAFPDGPAFDMTLCGDEVPARKPDPAPSLQAMAWLDVDPSRCVVIEDSLAGVTAGLAAGAAVLGVPALQQLPPAPGLTLRDTLEGVGLPELAAVLAARRPVDTTV
ncbi:MAG: HAD family hydrolase [Blastococcus sp.]